FASASNGCLFGTGPVAGPYHAHFRVAPRRSFGVPDLEQPFLSSRAEAFRELRECLTKVSSRSFFLSGRHVVASDSFGVIDANSTFGLGQCTCQTVAHASC